MTYLKPGEVLRDRYEIVEILGQGGMGCIYKAADRRLEGRLTAVKEVRTDPDGSADAQEQDRRQFQREANTLARLDHPNLPKVSDFFSVAEREFLVMDYVPGQDLREMIERALRRDEFIAEATVRDWARQLCDALSYLHSQDPPVLHRDIKPANIKLMPNGLIKLVDFGLVKVMGTDDQRTITVVQGRGTALYTPLEQYGGDLGHTDARSDIYALGATLYHLVTRTPPVEARQRFLDPRALRDPRELNPTLSDRLVRAILWAMAMHPDDRPASVKQFAEGLLGEGDLPVASATLRLERVRTNALDVSGDSTLGPGNTVLAILAGVLLILALLVTVFSPSLAR